MLTNFATRHGHFDVRHCLTLRRAHLRLKLEVVLPSLRDHLSELRKLSAHGLLRSVVKASQDSLTFERSRFTHLPPINFNPMHVGSYQMPFSFLFREREHRVTANRRPDHPRQPFPINLVDPVVGLDYFPWHRAPRTSSFLSGGIQRSELGLLYPSDPRSRNNKKSERRGIAFSQAAAQRTLPCFTTKRTWSAWYCRIDAAAKSGPRVCRD